jgi:hypothetical protein
LEIKKKKVSFKPTKRKEAKKLKIKINAPEKKETVSDKQLPR